MKKIIFAVALTASAIGFAQKRDFKKIEKAVGAGEFQEASDLFKGLDKASLDKDYVDDYEFYNGVLLLGNNPKNSNAQLNDLEMSITSLQKAEEMGYDKSAVSIYKGMATDAMLKMADQKLGEQKNDEALALVNKVMLLDPTNEMMKLNVADLSYRTQKYDAALKNYQELIDSGFTGSVAKHYAVDAATGEKKYFGNLKAAQLAILAPDYSTAGTEYGNSKVGPMVSNAIWLYKNAGKEAKAKQLFTDMQNKYPDDESLKLATPEIYNTLGMTDEYEKAVTAVNSEINDPKVFQNLAEASAAKANWDQAIDYYKSSIALDDKNYVTQNNLAAAYINKGNAEGNTADQQKLDYTNAVSHFEKAVELNPDLASASQTLVGLYEFLGMDEKAAAIKAKM